jgi:hypothetical protein
MKAIDTEAIKGLLAMRAEDEAIDLYAAHYSLTAEANGVEPDWELFRDLWNARHDSDEEMASLLAATEGIDYEEALRWVTGY